MGAKNYTFLHHCTDFDVFHQHITKKKTVPQEKPRALELTWKKQTASTATVTLSFVRISWGGTSNEIVLKVFEIGNNDIFEPFAVSYFDLRSTTLMSSMHGMMKNRPDP